jgi:hypothetical protein
MEQERHANTGASHRLVNNFNTRAEKYVENQVGNDIGLHTTQLTWAKHLYPYTQFFIIDQI